MQSSDKPSSDNSSRSTVTLDPKTLSLAAEDVRRLVEQQQQERQLLINQLNILFVTNSALLTFLVLSRLILVLSLFGILEILGLLANFILLIAAFLPRQISVSPQLEKQQAFLDYLQFDAYRYQWQMLNDLIESYNQNKKRLDGMSQTLSLAALLSGGVIAIALLHLLASYFMPEVKQP